MGALLISIGLIFAENAIEVSTGRMNAIIGTLLFFIGWGLFFSTQSSAVWKHGLVIPIIAMLGQLYMGWILGKPEMVRRGHIMYTMMFWMIFMIAWMNYIYRMNKEHTNSRMFVYMGIMLIMMSMMGYFFYRVNDWHVLTGGLIPAIQKTTTIFNPFVALFPFGWSVFAIGNSIED